VLTSDPAQRPTPPFARGRPPAAGVVLGGAAFRRRVSLAASLSALLGDELERVTAFGRVQRFGSGVFRRRPLVGSPPALERLSIGSPWALEHAF